MTIGNEAVITLIETAIVSMLEAKQLVRAMTRDAPSVPLSRMRPLRFVVLGRIEIATV